MKQKFIFPIYGVLCLLFMLSIITGWSAADRENQKNSSADGIFVRSYAEYPSNAYNVSIEQSDRLILNSLTAEIEQSKR